MKHSRLLLASVLLLPVSGMAQSWVVSGGFDYTTGDYGGSGDTDILTLPFSAKYEVGRWAYKLSVPYVRISGPTDVVGGVGPINRPGARSGTASGLGDPVFAVTYATLIDPDRPKLDLTGKVKLGVADEDIGTGESDFMFQGDLYETYGDWTPFGTLGYRVLGDPDGVTLKDGFYVSAGVSYRLDEPTRVGAVLDWRQRTVSGGENALELTGFVTRRLNEQWKAQVYLIKGFSDASPDYGLGGSLSYEF
jgi:hypothetical protein